MITTDYAYASRIVVLRIVVMIIVVVVSVVVVPVVCVVAFVVARAVAVNQAIASLSFVLNGFLLVYGFCNLASL